MIIILARYLLGGNPSWWGLIGAFCWLLAYALIVWKAHREKTYGLPAAATCFNFTWELFFSFQCFPFSGPEAQLICGQGGIPWPIVAWCALDAINLLQVVRYGARSTTWPFRPTTYIWTIAGGLLLAYALQASFMAFNRDAAGLQDAWLIAFLMSLLFLGRFAGPEGRNLSWPAAWLMLAGNLANVIWIYEEGVLPFPGHNNIVLIYLLCASTLTLNLAYAVFATRLLHLRQ